LEQLKPHVSAIEHLVIDKYLKKDGKCYSGNENTKSCASSSSIHAPMVGLMDGRTAELLLVKHQWDFSVG
jgi:hypothetical protein